MKRLLLPLLLTAFVLGPAAKSDANLIVNGSFETTPTPLPGSNWDLFDSILGWTSSGAPIEIGHGDVYGVSGHVGNNVLELDSTGNATVSQTVTITTAGNYQLSFLAALRAGVGIASQGFSVVWNGVTLDSNTPGSTSMSSFVYGINALPGSYVLSFVGIGTNDSLGTLIDDVQLNAVNGVPDGGVAATLLGLALAGVGVFRRMAR